jgi:hypothetical protein
MNRAGKSRIFVYSLEGRPIQVREQANMSKRLQGGCLCGAARYETAASHVFAVHSLPRSDSR